MATISSFHCDILDFCHTIFFRDLNFVDRCKKYLLSQPIVQRLQQLVTLATTDIALRVVLLVLQYEVDIATIFLMVATTS